MFFYSLIESLSKLIQKSQNNLKLYGAGNFLNVRA